MINKFAITVANVNRILSCAATGLTGFPVNHRFRCVNFLITSVWGLDSWGKKMGKLTSCKLYIDIVPAEKHVALQPASCFFTTLNLSENRKFNSLPHQVAHVQDGLEQDRLDMQ